MADLTALADIIHRNVRHELGLTSYEMRHAQVHCVAEEAGEFVGAFRRWMGMARRSGDFADVQAELADVVISAYTAARALGFNLDDAIDHKAEKVLTRGWKEKPSASVIPIKVE